MRRGLARALFLLVTLCATPLAAGEEDTAEHLLASGDVRVDVSLVPGRAVYVGQKVRLRLRLLTTSFFKAAPRLPEVDIPRAIVRQESQMAINATDRLEGKTYASQTWEFAIYPQRQGTYKIPTLDVVMTVADEDGQAVLVAARTAATSFEATIPEGAGALASVLSSSALTLEQTLDRNLDGLQVGDAFRRSLTLTIQDAPGMLLPPIGPQQVEGIAAYADAPRVDDKVNRGDLTGTRIEQVSYVLQREGEYVFPELRIRWWNLEEGRLAEAVLPALRFTVAKQTGLETGSRSTSKPDAGPARRSPASTKRLWLEGLGLLLLLAILYYTLRRKLPTWRAEHARALERRAHSGSAYFRRLEQACREGNPREARLRLQVWLDVRAGAERVGTVDAFIEDARIEETRGGKVDSARVAATLRGLDTRLYGPAQNAKTDWSGTELASVLAAAREVLRKRGPARNAAGVEGLNPRHTLRDLAS